MDCALAYLIEEVIERDAEDKYLKNLMQVSRLNPMEPGHVHTEFI